MIAPFPDHIKYEPAENIELVPTAYVYADSVLAVVPVSQTGGFANAQSLLVIAPDWTLQTLALAASSAVNKKNRTLTLSAAPSSPILKGSSIIGPSLMDLGGTNGGVQWAAKPDNVNIEIDQVEVDVRRKAVHWNVDARFSLAEFDVKQWGMVSQLGYTIVPAATGVKGFVMIDQLGDFPISFGSVFTYHSADPTEDVLKDKVILWNVASVEGIETSTTKRDATMLPVGFHALGDPLRPRNKRVWRIIQETDLALP